MPRASRVAPVLDGALILVGTLALLAWIADGLQLPLGIATLSIRSPLRPVLLLLVLGMLRLAIVRRHPALFTTPALPHLPLAILTLTSLGYGLLYLTTICGGADSYGYVSAAFLLREGTLSSPQPEAAWLPATNATAVLTPLGYVPSQDGGSVVPLYPLGFPGLIAAASLVLPDALAPYLVAPFMTGVLLLLVFRIARQWTGDSGSAWLGVALTAWDPLVITYAKQPMSDIPAAAWLLLSIWCIVRPLPLPLVAGLAAGASFLTRPGGIGAVAAVGLLASLHLRPQLPSLTRFMAGLIPCVALQAAVQWQLFGSPWRTGYGAIGELYAGATLSQNALIYGRALVTTHAVVWVPLIGAGLIALRTSGTALWLLLLVGASLTPYLLYFQFDHWETLRFVLPAVVLLDVAAAAGASFVLQHIRPQWMRPVAVVAVAALTFLQARTFLEREGVPTLMEQERRYVLTAEWIGRHTPEGTLVLAGQHSGSLRHYAGRTTLRWDMIVPDDLGPVIREARRRGHLVYAALDGHEQEPFRERFAATLQPAAPASPALVLLPGAQVGNVQIWEIVPSGETP